MGGARGGAEFSRNYSTINPPTKTAVPVVKIQQKHPKFSPISANVYTPLDVNVALDI